MILNTNHLKNSWNEILKSNSFILACHVRPDGDTLGSSLALARALRQAGKNDVVVVCEGGVPENYKFIPESDNVITHTDRRDFDLGVLVDSEGLKRVGSAAEVVNSARRTACIDHHVPSNEFGDIRIVDKERSSTAEVVYELLEANGVVLDQVLATQLLTGLIADTGAFRFANTSSRTFHIAAALTDTGAEPWTIAREVYDTKPMRAVRLLGKALCSLECDDNENVIWAVIRRSDLDELGATDSDTESVVNHVAAVKGPKVAILFRELEPGAVRVSLRSRSGVDVNKVAGEFGGGGHTAAAGCTVHAPLEEAVRQVVDEVRKWTES